jgi:hypothetical protein
MYKLLWIYSLYLIFAHIKSILVTYVVITIMFPKNPTGTVYLHLLYEQNRDKERSPLFLELQTPNKEF